MATLVGCLFSNRLNFRVASAITNGIWRVKNSSYTVVGHQRSSHLWPKKFVRSRAFYPRFVLTKYDAKIRKAWTSRHSLGSTLCLKFSRKQRSISSQALELNDRNEILQNDNSPIGKATRTFRLTKQKIFRENIATIPNLLCATRIALSPVLGYLVLQENFTWALGIFVYAGTTDMLDGMIARHYPSQKSMFGSFLDPLADKLLISILFLSLTAVNLIPISLTALIIVRDACLLSAGFYVRYLSLPPPKTLARYFDPTHATVKISPTFLSKANTAMQLVLVASTLAAPVFHFTQHPALHTLWYITAASTIFSGLSYVFKRDTFTLIRSSRLQRKRMRKSRINQDIY